MNPIPPLCLSALLLSACAMPPLDLSVRQRIRAEMNPSSPGAEVAPAASLPVVPVAMQDSLLPPLKPAWAKARASQLEQRFDLVVTDAPLDSLLAAIVEDTPYSILVKPRLSGTPMPPAPERVTLRLKNTTLTEALDALREVYGYDYQIEGRRIYVLPPELQTRLYQINYVIGQRRGVSDLQVVGGASRPASAQGQTLTASTGGAAGTGNSSYASLQASALSTVTKADLWGELEDTLRTALGCQIPRSQSGGGSAAGATGRSSRADVSFHGENQVSERQHGIDGCSEGKALTVNPMSGTILVRALPRELSTVEKMLRTMQINVERQVIIEAKIIDVELNEGAQQGVNWSAFGQGLHRFSVGTNTSLIGAAAAAGISGGALASDASLAALLGAGMVGSAGQTGFSSGLGMALQVRNFSALINFLQTQGHVHVLSSPRIATLNNQKAVLKVGSEEPYVTGISSGTTTPGTGGSATIVTPPTLQYQPFFSGISLDVTPHIDASNNVTLHVHTLVNHVVERLKISQPSSTAVYVPFASNTINEVDSVVRTRDGQMVVIGGLMTERAQDERQKVPTAGDMPVAGALFGKSTTSSGKRELVILLKPTVVKDEQAWSQAIDATRARLADLDAELPPLAR